MGSSSQAIRYPVATTGAGNIDALNRVLADLCTGSNPKDGAALTLRRLVEEEARDLSGEAFARFMDHLYELITTFLDSNEVSENRDPEILVLASKFLGHLDRSGGAMTADEVERQVKVALEWLRGERIEYRRFAAVLILKEMAENSSTVFNVHVPEFVDAIWVALRDPTLVVREKAIEALRACLRVIEKSETRWSVQWYYRMFEATQDGLGRNSPVHSIHGSLLAVGELLSIPPLLPTTQNRLLECISAILSRSHHSMPRQSASFSLILDLGLQGHDLLDFARESVVVYLEDEDGATRKDVALCCCKLVANSFSAISSTQFGPSRINRSSGKRRHRVVEEVYF
ncbi:Serine/threonine-protein kinase TOR [Capsicum chinense]|nr:Serine/threonine-protein kinase TOR [Capsicum chinense]